VIGQGLPIYVALEPVDMKIGLRASRQSRTADQPLRQTVVLGDPVVSAPCSANEQSSELRKFVRERGQVEQASQTLAPTAVRARLRRAPTRRRSRHRRRSGTVRGGADLDPGRELAGILSC
jgi:hypothetical protein